MPDTPEYYVPNCLNVPENRWGWHWKAFERARFPSYQRNRSIFGRMLNQIYEIGTTAFSQALTFDTGVERAKMHVRREAPAIIEDTYRMVYENTAREFAQGWRRNMKSQKQGLIENLFIGEEPDEDEDQDIITLSLLAVRDFFTAMMFQRQQVTLAQHIQSITGTHADIVGSNLRQQATEFLGLDPGQPVPPMDIGQINQIAALTRNRLRSQTPTHSKFFSTTNTVAASNLGILAVAQAQQQRTGQQLGKMWLSQRDSRVRDTHVTADGQQIPLSGLFSVGGSLLAFPGDWTHGARLKEIINCRCVLIFFSQN